MARRISKSNMHANKYLCDCMQNKDHMYSLCRCGFSVGSVCGSGQPVHVSHTEWMAHAMFRAGAKAVASRCVPPVFGSLRAFIEPASVAF
jgi:hypothetical protein